MTPRETILQRELKPALVPLGLPEWGDVHVRTMTSGEMDAYEGECHTETTKGRAFVNFRARLLVRVLCDCEGNRIFTPDDTEALAKLPSDEVRKAFDVAAPIVRITKEDERELEKHPGAADHAGSV
jgi:hypothetical protein